MHRTGRLQTALIASVAIPGLFPPVRLDGRLLIDGGVLDNLPVSSALRTPAQGPIIAIDTGEQPEQVRSRKRPRLNSVARLTRLAVVGVDYEIPHIGETLVRTVGLASSGVVARARQKADLVIAPELTGVGTLEWGRIAEVYDIGRRAAVATIESNADLIASWASPPCRHGIPK